MADEKLRQQRIKNIVDATSLREPDKVPVGIEVITWPLAYAGVTYKEVVDNPEALAAAYTQFLDDIEIDYYSMAIGTSVPVKCYEELGSKQYLIAKDGVCLEHYQANDEYMKDDEYDEFIENYMAFKAEKLAKRRFPIFTGPRDEAYEALKKAAVAYGNHLKANMLIAQEVASRDIVALGGFEPGDNAPRYSSPFNTLFDYMRGIKNSLIDLRRRPDKVAAAVKAIEAAAMPVTTDPKSYLNRDPFPLSMTIYHSECFLSNKQFDELYFQGFKKTCLPFMECGAKYYLKGEGHFLNTLDRFKELPKGSMVIILDEDDPFEAYKYIEGYHTIAAGITSDLLKFGTKQKCIDYVKKCYDTFAPGGGFIFMPNKPLMSASDVKTENLIAVYEFANEYGKKR